MIDRKEAAERALVLATRAAEMVMAVYAAPFDVDYKGKDDPVTRADREANTFLVHELARAYPGVPIVAEESDPSEFVGWTTSKEAWFVDPLDGTREFVAKNGEFAVMVGLAQHGRAAVGVLVCPALRQTLVGIVGAGAFEVDESGQRRPIHASAERDLSRARVVVSRSHRAPILDAAVQALAAADVVPTGSSGVKAARIATGAADVYLQPGPAGKLWDACAPAAVVVAAGGSMTQSDGTPFDYRAASLVNARGLVATNGALHREVLARLAPVVRAPSA